MHKTTETNDLAAGSRFRDGVASSRTTDPDEDDAPVTIRDLAPPVTTTPGDEDEDESCDSTRDDADDACASERLGDHPLFI